MSGACCSKKSILLTFIYCKCLSKWDKLLNQSAINGEDKGGELRSGNLLKKGHAGEDGQILTCQNCWPFAIPLTLPGGVFLPKLKYTLTELAVDTAIPLLQS